MPQVSLTSFVDFVAATGTARLTKVRAAKKFYEEGYSPQRDYYKPLRDRIDDCLQSGWKAANLKKALSDVDDGKKVENYEECRQGLSKWIGKKKIKMLDPVKGTWKSSGLELNVNPEVHAEINGKKYLIKLYLKAEPLSKQKANVVHFLLEQYAGTDTEVGVLDVRRSKLFTPTVPIPGMEALLAAEAAAMSTLWAAV